MTCNHSSLSWVNTREGGRIPSFNHGLNLPQALLHLHPHSADQTEFLMFMWIFLLSSVNVYELLRSLGLNPEVLCHKYVFQLWLRVCTVFEHLCTFMHLHLCVVSNLLQCICAYLWSLIGSYFDVLEFKPLDMLLQSSTSHLTGYNWIPKGLPLPVKCCFGGQRDWWGVRGSLEETYMIRQNHAVWAFFWSVVC